MVRSRQLAGASGRSGPVRLIVTAVERGRAGDGSAHLVALHGFNAGRPWRLTLADALAALGTGRYVFDVEFQGERRRAEVLGNDGALRLFAPSPVHGDLIEALPDWIEAGREPAAVASARHNERQAVVSSAPAA